jgi:hypothetical protein
MPGRHAAHGLARHQNGTRHIEIDAGPKGCRFRRIKTAAASCYACIVDDMGNGAKLACGLIKEPDHVLLKAHVTCNGHGPAAGARNIANNFIGALAVTEEIDRHTVTLSRCNFSNSSTDAAPAARYHQNFRYSHAALRLPIRASASFGSSLPS